MTMKAKLHSSDTITTGFRDWLELLRDVRGHRPLWPVLLGAALDAEFRRQIESDSCYARDVFKNRDEHVLDDGDREERQVARLYRSALANDGCVVLNHQRIWLLGFQWPTQGGFAEKQRKADLVGITEDGALVVFEAKIKSGNSPLIAIMEGLDYLACLLRPKNFEKLVSGFDAWIKKPGKAIPAGFENTIPCRTVKPKLIVLAPEKYFTERQAKSIRGRDWPYLAAIGDSMIESVHLDFAATDYCSPTLWKPPVHKV